MWWVYIPRMTMSKTGSDQLVSSKYNLKNMKYSLKHIIQTGLAVCLLWHNAIGQNPAPGDAQTEKITLSGANIHIGNGQVISNGSITFEKGIITYVGEGKGNGGKEVNVAGKHIYPGLISLNTTVGLQEVASVRATLDYREVGQNNAHVRALVAYNTDSEVIPTLRGNGILLSQAVPEGGIISGSSSTFYTDGWSWEDAVLAKDDGIWIAWPSFLSSSFSYEDFTTITKRNEKRQETIDLFYKTFSDAKAYNEIKDPNPVNLRLKALQSVLSGGQNLYIRAQYAKDIVESVRFAKHFGINKIVIAGGDESYKIIPFLKENKVSIIVNPTHRLPDRADEAVYLPYELPGKLFTAGVKVAITYSNEWWRTRNLAFLAGTAAGFSNLTPEQTLQMITKNAAEIIGAEKWVGTLEKGKHASLIVANGDLLDMRGNSIEMAYIKGAQVDLDDKQKRLYEKYKEKYKSN